MTKCSILQAESQIETRLVLHVKSRIWNEILTVLALAFLFAYSYPAFVVDISIGMKSKLDVIQLISWLAFATDLIVGIFRAQDRKKYLFTHPLEILAVVLPFMRPLRLLRVISFGSLVVQKVAIGRSFSIALKVIITSIFMTYIAAIQMTQIERGVDGSNIKGFQDSLWWAISTVTTVGYGDRYPTTTEGRFLAFALMIMGISLLGVITATIAAWFVKLGTVEVD